MSEKVTLSKHPPCDLISWGQVYGLCRKLAYKIRASGFTPDLIVAIGRGGYVPARILADLLGLMDLVGVRIEHYHGARKGTVARIRQPLSMGIGGRRILLLDDVSDTGETFEVALEHLRKNGATEQIHTAVIHHKITSCIEPDFYAQKIVKWRWIIYPWAVLEDLSAFAREFEPIPGDPETLGRLLWSERGLKVKRATLEDVLALVAVQPKTCTLSID